jgi:hypothetical protein
MTLNQIVALADDATFQGQVRAAAVAYAATALQAPHTAHEAADLLGWALAASTIADGCTANLTRFVWGIAATPGFSAIVTDTNDTNDAAVNSAMVSQWQNIAGVTAGNLGK